MVFHRRTAGWTVPLFCAGALLACMALEWFLSPQIGPAAAALEIVPVILFAWTFGPAVGVASCLALLFTDFVFLLPSRGLPATGSTATILWPLAVAELGAALAVGRLRELTDRLTREASERHRTELELRQTREQLERRVAERAGELAIRESESRLTLALNVAEMGMWDWDLLTGGIVWSESMQRLFDPAMSPLKVTLEWIMDRVLPEDRHILQSAIQAASERAGEYQAEYRVRRTDGAIRWMLTKGGAIHDDSNRAVRISGINVDITDRRMAEERLRASEERFQIVARATRDVIYDWDIAADHLWWNENAQLVFGYSPEAVGSCAAWWEEHLHPADRERVCASLKSAVAEGQVWEQDYRFRRADGSYADIFERGFVIRGEDGKAVRMMGSIMDLTERKRAQEALRHREKFYRALLENSMDNITVMQPDGTTIYESPSSERLSGHTPEELLGGNGFALIHPDDVERVAARFHQDLERGTVGPPIRYRIRHKNGTWRVNESVGQRFLDENGRALAIVNTRDVTDRDLLEQQLRQAQKMEAIGNLAGGIAHDFNNLLTVIMNYSHLATGDLPEESPIRKDLEEITRASERACGLTRQLLAFSRKQVLNPETTSFNTILSGTANMLRRLIGEDVDLQTEMAADLCPVRADVGQIEQVILNLAVNARDAMPTGGKLTIATCNARLTPAQASHLDTTESECAVLTVTDTGMGMDAETQHRIFEPFFTTKEAGKGTGLGLSTVYGIVQQSGGLVEVESGVGRGTTFRIFLPRAAGVKEAPIALPRKPVETPAAGMILLTEDEDTLRRLARFVLEKHGYGVLEAANADAAIEVAAQHPGRIDLLLTDVVMPGRSGRELAEELQPRRPDLRVLYMSGYTDDAVVRHGVKYDRVALLQKPFTPEALLEGVRGVLNERAKVALCAS